MTLNPRRLLPDDRSSPRNVVLFFFGLSLVVRLACVLPVLASSMQPLYDEGNYYQRAVAFSRIASQLAAGDEPAREDLNSAYQFGAWPPLHSILMAIPMCVFGPSLASARLTVVVLSALTTSIVYLLTAGLASRRAARAAAYAHVVYPSFLGFSHFLWSETTFIATSLLALHFALRAAAAPVRRLAPALACGLFLGMSLLTRAAGLPLLVLLPAWLLFARDARGSARLGPPAAAVVVAVLLVAPWEAVMAKREGRFFPVSTAAGFNLLLGNNEWRLDGLRAEVRPRAKAAVTEYARERGVDRDTAARAIALDYIRNNRVEFSRGVWARLRSLWTADTFIVRHVLKAAYPPMATPVVAAIWLYTIAGFLVLIFYVARGTMAIGDGFRHGGLVAGAVLLGMLPALATIGNTRMSLPLLALLLPLFGHGAAGGERRAGSRRAALCAGISALFALNTLTLPRDPGEAFASSAYYGPLLGRLEERLGWKSRFSDRVEFRLVGEADSVGVSIEDARYRFQAQGPALSRSDEEGRDRERYWRLSPRSPEFDETFLSEDARVPLEIGVTSARTAGRPLLRPINPAAWLNWRETGVDGLQYRWMGGAKDVVANE